MSDRKKSKRIALLSDVHGNLPALKAVLDDAAAGNAEAIWNLGDFLGYAPFPNEVVRALREMKAVSIIGNYDLKVLDFQEKREKWRHRKAPQKYTAFQWNYEHLSRDTREYLKSLPEQTRVRVNAFDALLVHGSPDSIEEVLGTGTPDARFGELADSSGADLIVCGHSHEAFVKRVRGTWFVNPGSAGRPEGGSRRASYALLEFSANELKVRHRVVAYDVERVVRAVHAAGLPADFIGVFRKAPSLNQVRGKTVRRRMPKAAYLDSDGVRDKVIAFARNCHYEREHTHQVTGLALELFDGTVNLHGMGKPERQWLEYGALLHDIGWIEGQAGHHKTALDLIMAEPNLPFQRRERTIIGLIARYHRKALPSERHRYFRELSQEDRHRVQVLAGILRIADGLDRSHENVVRHLSSSISDREVAILCEVNGSAANEAMAAKEKADLFERVFARRCVIETRTR